MGCGCKKKRLPDPAEQPRTLNKVVIVEGQVRVPDDIRPPDVLQPPADINKIVDKLNEILTPQK